MNILPIYCCRWFPSWNDRFRLWGPVCPKPDSPCTAAVKRSPTPLVGFLCLLVWISCPTTKLLSQEPDASHSAEPVPAPMEQPLAEAVPAPSDQPLSPAELAAGETKILQTLEQLRASVKKVKLAEVAYMISKFDDSEEHDSAYNQAISEGKVIKQKLLDLAYPILLQSPQLSEEMLELGRIMMYGLFEDYQYERCYQIAVQMNKRQPDESIQLMLMRSAMLTNRFEIAAEYREKVATRIQDLPKLELSMLKTLPDLIRIGTEERKWRLEEQDGNLPRVQIVTTEGSFVVELFEDQYPDTVGHFMFLVEKKFYNQMVFHRVTKNFLPFSVAQTGFFSLRDVTGSKQQAWYSHNIEYKIKDEKPQDGRVRRHLRGVLSFAVMNREGQPIPNSASSQFMITLVPSPALDGNQVAFGRIIEGLDVIDRFSPNVNVSEEDGSEKPIENPKFSSIQEIKVLRKRDHEYLPNKVE